MTCPPCNFWLAFTAGVIIGIAITIFIIGTAQIIIDHKRGNRIR